MANSNTTQRKTLLDTTRKALNLLNTSFLKKAGLSKSKIQFEIFNQYPPLQVLGEIKNPDLIFLPKKSPTNKESIALYLHIPFCLRRCTFCCFYSVERWNRGDINSYVSYLGKEIGMVSDTGYFKNKIVTSVFWGGGTPTLLQNNQISHLMGLLKKKFTISPDAEITFEATPETITPQKLLSFRKNGFNRLSLGIQSFDNKVLRLNNRLQTSTQSLQAFNLSKSAGFSNINIDLMFQLPGPIFKKLGNDLATALQLGAANITAYPFKVCISRPNTYRALDGFLKQREERLLMHLMAIELFTKSGYIQFTPYQFAVSSRYYFRHQEHKASNGQIHGFGVTGHSFLNNFEYHNCSNLINYEKALKNNILPIERGRYLNKKEQMIRFVIYRLQKTSGINRKDGGIDSRLFNGRFGVIVTRIFKSIFKKLIHLGVLKKEGNFICFTCLGLLFHTEAIQLFYLKKDRNKIAEVVKTNLI